MAYDPLIPIVGIEDLWVARAEAQRTHEVPDGHLMLAEPHSYVAAEEPSDRQVWIEHNSLVSHCSAVVEVAGVIGEREPSDAQREGVIAANLRDT